VVPVKEMTIYPVIDSQMTGKYSTVLQYPGDGVAQGLIGVFYISPTYEGALAGLQVLVNKGFDYRWLGIVGPDGRCMSFSVSVPVKADKPASKAEVETARVRELLAGLNL
jgi:hypothetical protein